LFDERSGTGLIYAGIWKNGSEATIFGYATAAGTESVMATDLIYFNGTTDYVEVYIYDQAATSRTLISSVGNVNYFSGVWIRS
jgi:hypothetical protein